MQQGVAAIVRTVGFNILGHALGRDVRDAIAEALKAGARFGGRARPLTVFRSALAESIRDVSSHPRGTLLQRFLRDGPYEGEGQIPAELEGQRLSDEETAAAIAFIYSFMIPCFQGQLAELLAARACVRLTAQLQGRGRLSAGARWYMGDTVRVPSARGHAAAKAADLHLLVPDGAARGRIMVAGVAEVKSYRRRQRQVTDQLDKHVRRLAHGLCVRGRSLPPDAVRLFRGDHGAVIRVRVVPADWKLPRSFRFEPTKNGRALIVDDALPVQAADSIEEIGHDEWRVTLRWSEEALANAAYEMTFWYMAKVGEVAYASGGVPADWDMTPAEAGRNAAKMMLYYALLRCAHGPQEQRAIALYNAYSFGYSLGMNFRDAQGRREMLWPQDLDEIAQNGRTRHGSRIRRPRHGYGQRPIDDPGRFRAPVPANDAAGEDRRDFAPAIGGRELGRAIRWH